MNLFIPDPVHKQQGEEPVEGAGVPGEAALVSSARLEGNPWELLKARAFEQLEVLESAAASAIEGKPLQERFAQALQAASSLERRCPCEGSPKGLA